MSHEIRTPLNAIIHFTERARRSPVDADLKEDLDTVRTSAQWLIQVVSDVLEVTSCPESAVQLKDEPFSVRECVDAAVQMIRIRAEGRRLQIRSVVDPEIPDQVRGDFIRLLKVIFNLLENAVRRTSDGGVLVTVQTAARTDGEMVIGFTVGDTGVGLPDDQAKDFFQPLAHPLVEEKRPGDVKESMASAFGMAICQNIVRLMGGSMEAESRLGAGTVVRFTVQVQTIAEQEYVDSSVRHVSSGGIRPLRILLADQNPISRRLTKVILESEGHSVLEAQDASEVVPMFSQEEFELVLLDLEMESPRDFELTRRLRSGEKKNVHTPIYVLFNPSGLVDRESCRSAGLDGFLAKPIETDAVLNVVAAIAIRGKPAETRAQKGVQVTQGKGRASLRLAVRGMKAIPASFGHAIGPS